MGLVDVGTCWEGITVDDRCWGNLHISGVWGQWRPSADDNVICRRWPWELSPAEAPSSFILYSDNLFEQALHKHSYKSRNNREAQKILLEIPQTHLLNEGKTTFRLFLPCKLSWLEKEHSALLNCEVKYEFNFLESAGIRICLWWHHIG